MNACIKTIIVDDEISNIKHLCNDLAGYAEINIVEVTTSIAEARQLIIEHQPDLLFIDVEMPRMNGIQFFNEVRYLIHSQVYVVFYLAFDGYMIDIIKALSYDYLLKPYLSQELREIVERAKERIKINRIPSAQTVRRLPFGYHKFALHTVNNLLLLSKKEIVCFQYLNETRCWQITLINLSTHKLRLSTTAKEILSISISFIQVSQNCILNLDYVTSIENKTLQCVLCPPFDKFKIFVSRRYYSKIKAMLEII